MRLVVQVQLPLSTFNIKFMIRTLEFRELVAEHLERNNWTLFLPTRFCSLKNDNAEKTIGTEIRTTNADMKVKFEKMLYHHEN